MKRKHLAIALPLAMLLAMSCKEEKKPENIIVKKTPVAVKKSVQSMGDNAAERDVEWLGATYHIRIERKADKSLSLAKDGQGNKYYDNRVSLLITRPDGSEFVRRTFSKTDFASYVNGTNSEGALLGIVFDRADGETLRFAASVGSPDRMSDEYVPLVLTVSRTGGVKISEDTQLDTGSDEEEEEV